MMTTLLSELLTLRDRLDTVELLLDREGVLTRAALEAFRPDADLEQAREAQHLAILRRVFRVLRDEFEDYDTPIPQ